MGFGWLSIPGNRRVGKISGNTLSTQSKGSEQLRCNQSRGLKDIGAMSLKIENQVKDLSQEKDLSQTKDLIGMEALHK
jgi:hypothetical protein